MIGSFRQVVSANEHQNHLLVASLCRRPITTIEGIVPAVDRA
jgi:hypothetical protein